MKKWKNEQGAISVIVLVTILFFITILTATYMTNAIVRKAQIKSQLTLQDEYGKMVKNEALRQEVYESYVGH